MVFKIALLLFGLASINVAKDCNSKDIYWRIFDGKIPFDAYPAGADNHDEPIFVGQALYKSSLIPVKIYPNKPEGLFYAENAEKKSTENIKILCTRSPKKFVWVNTTRQEVHAGSVANPILGGHEDDFPRYIGRMLMADGELAPGNVQKRPDDYDTRLIVVSREGPAYEYHIFEILTYVA